MKRVHIVCDSCKEGVEWCSFEGAWKDPKWRDESRLAIKLDVRTVEVRESFENPMWKSTESKTMQRWDLCNVCRDKFYDSFIKTVSK